VEYSVPILAGLEESFDIRETGYRNTVAAEAIQGALGSVNQEWETRTSSNSQGNQGVDTDTIHNEPDMGLTPHCWRTGKAWYRRGEIDRREIHGKSKQTTESDMAKLFKESYKGFSIYRLHRCTDGTIHDALCFGVSLS